jgi:hypothetical protein
MSRPSSPRVPGTFATAHQQQSLSRPSLDEPHDLPYLRADGPSSSSIPSSPQESSPSPLQNRPAHLPVRASTLGSPVTEQPKHELPPRGSQSTSGHSPQDEIAPPNPTWLNTSATRTGSSEENNLLPPRSPHPSSTVSGHSASTSAINAQPCSGCGLPMTGQFVRALGTVYHLDCFRCKVSNTSFLAYVLPFLIQHAHIQGL